MGESLWSLLGQAGGRAGEEGSAEQDFLWTLEAKLA